MEIRTAVAADVPGLQAIHDPHALGTHTTFHTEPLPREVWLDQLASAHPGDHVVVADDATGRGLGRALYGELLGRLTAAGMHTAVAGVALPNDASIALHTACGVEEIGTFREVGRKFDRWIDVLWFQRMLR